MITIKELNSIDRDYFTVITEGCFGVTLQSKNTHAHPRTRENT